MKWTLRFLAASLAFCGALVTTGCTQGNEGSAGITGAPIKTLSKEEEEAQRRAMYEANKPINTKTYKPPEATK